MLPLKECKLNISTAAICT